MGCCVVVCGGGRSGVCVCVGKGGPARAALPAPRRSLPRKPHEQLQRVEPGAGHQAHLLPAGAHEVGVSAGQAPAAGLFACPPACLCLPAHAANPGPAPAVFELSGDLPLQVKQSARSLKAIQLWEQAQQGRAAQHAARAARQQTQQAQREQGHPAPVAADGLAALCAGGEAVPLAGPVRPTKRFLVCEGPPSAVLWVGSIAGCATLDDMHSLFSRWAAWRHGPHASNQPAAAGGRGLQAAGAVPCLCCCLLLCLPCFPCPFLWPPSLHGPWPAGAGLARWPG